MNQSVFSPESGVSSSIGPPGFVAVSTEEQAMLWQQVLAHSTNGLVGLMAVRSDSSPNAPIINFRYRFINEIALRDTFRADLGNVHDITGRLLTDFFPSIREAPHWQTYVKVVETGEAQRVEQAIKVDGQDVWITQSATAFGKDGLLLAYSDNSDLYQATRRLSRQTILLNTVLNASPNAVVVLEAVRNEQQETVDFQISLTNRRFDSLAGQGNLSYIGLLLTQVYPLDLTQMNRLRRLMADRETIHTQEFIPALGRWLDITLTHLNDGVMATIQDITADKQIRQQLETAVQELHRSNQNLEQFAYVASHDLQEPLRKIVSFGDVLTDQFSTEMSASAADLIRRMQASAGRMRSLVQDLLTYSRLESSADLFSLVDLNHLVASVADDLEVTIRERQVTLHLETLPAVWGDAGLLRQLFQNLLSNALKFHQLNRPDEPALSPQVIIKGHVATHNELPVDMSASDASQEGRRYAWIEVIDNGIGFNEQYLDRIFTIFQRLHGRTNYPGTGMGLAICKKVVDIHRGHITAISREGQGATFVLLLPMQ